MARQQRGRSQEWWTEGEALERAGNLTKAVTLYAKAAVAEEDAGQPLKARILWEQIAGKTGASGIVLERLATSSERAKIADEAFDYWLAAAVRYHGEGRPDDAKRARERAQVLRKRVGAHQRPPLAEAALSMPARHFIEDLL